MTFRSKTVKMATDNKTGIMIIKYCNILIIKNKFINIKNYLIYFLIKSLQIFVDNIIHRMIFDGEQLTDLLEPLNLSWRERGSVERALMEDLIPHLHKIAQGREISGLASYE